MRGRRCLVPVCVALAAVVAAGCSKKKADDSESSEPTAAPEKPAEKEKAAEPAAGFGSITGTVSFAGKAPEAKDLPRKADPVCAAKPMKDNEVIVNSNNTLKDVLVRVAPGAVKGKFSAPDQTVNVKQQDCMYVPRVQGAVAGQVVQ